MYSCPCTRATLRYQFAMERVHRIASLSIEIVLRQNNIPGRFCFTYLSPGTLTMTAFFLCLILLWVDQASQFEFLMTFSKTCQPMIKRKITINTGNMLFTYKRNGLKYTLCTTSRHKMPEQVRKYLLNINGQAPRLRK